MGDFFFFLAPAVMLFLHIISDPDDLKQAASKQQSQGCCHSNADKIMCVQVPAADRLYTDEISNKKMSASNALQVTL